MHNATGPGSALSPLAAKHQVGFELDSPAATRCRRGIYLICFGLVRGPRAVRPLAQNCVNSCGCAAFDDLVLVGGESGIRTLAPRLDSASYTFPTARVAVDASDAVAPSPLCPAVMSVNVFSCGGYRRKPQACEPHPTLEVRRALTPVRRPPHLRLGGQTGAGRSVDEKRRTKMDTVTVLQHCLAHACVPEHRPILAPEILEQHSRLLDHDTRVATGDAGRIEAYRRKRVAADDVLARLQCDAAPLNDEPVTDPRRVRRGDVDVRAERVADTMHRANDRPVAIAVLERAPDFLTRLTSVASDTKVPGHNRSCNSVLVTTRGASPIRRASRSKAFGVK